MTTRIFCEARPERTPTGATAENGATAVLKLADARAVVAVGSARGGVGKSAVCVNVATQIAGYWNTTTSTSPTVSLLRRIPEQPWNDAFGLNYAGTSDATTSAGSGGASSCTQGT